MNPPRITEFEIIFDCTHPDAGGFNPGAQFTRAEMIYMLAQKILAYGTNIRHIPTGDMYHVDYDYK